MKKLHDDILEILDDDSGHFLGAIIIYSITTKPSEPDIYNLIDGQQRITTIFLYLLAGILELVEINEKLAVKYFKKFITIEGGESLESNLKLHPCLEDRMEVNEIINEILSNNPLRESLGDNTPKKFSNYVKTSRGRIINNFKYAKRFFNKARKEFGDAKVEGIIECILSSFSIVQIDVKDPISGPKIFDSLNSKQEPMTIGDLVRNGIFSIKYFEDGERMKYLNENCWIPFYEKFFYGGKDYFEGYFFPYGLIKNPNLKKSQVYNYLQRDWSERGLDPEDIISELREYQDSYMLISTEDINFNNMLEKEVAYKIQDLNILGLPSSSYPYFMKILRQYELKNVDKRSILNVLNVLESFFLRRAVCGIEPTGLHAVFKRLWQDTNGSLDIQEVVNKIKSHKTVIWPSDEDFIIV